MEAERIEALRVEIAPDGTSMTAFFQGGDPNCYTVCECRDRVEGLRDPGGHGPLRTAAGTAGMQRRPGLARDPHPLEPPFLR